MFHVTQLVWGGQKIFPWQDHLWQGGTNYSAVVGPRGTIYSAAHGLGGPYAAAMDGPGGPQWGGTIRCVTMLVEET